MPPWIGWTPTTLDEPHRRPGDSVASTGPDPRRGQGCLCLDPPGAGRAGRADRPGSWPFRLDRAVFIPWADVEQVVIYPRTGDPAGSPARRIGIQCRPGAPELRKGDKPDPGCPLPRVTMAATEPVSGWRLDRDRLAAVIAAVAPGVPVIDISTIDTSNGPAPISEPSNP